MNESVSWIGSMPAIELKFTFFYPIYDNFDDAYMLSLQHADAVCQ